jgi:hypothetical protein
MIFTLVRLPAGMSNGNDLDVSFAEAVYQAKGKSGKNVAEGIFGVRWPSFRGVEDTPDRSLELSNKCSGDSLVQVNIPIAGSLGFGQGGGMKANPPMGHRVILGAFFPQNNFQMCQPGYFLTS